LIITIFIISDEDNTTALYKKGVCNKLAIVQPNNIDF